MGWGIGNLIGFKIGRDLMDDYQDHKRKRKDKQNSKYINNNYQTDYNDTYISTNNYEDNPCDALCYEKIFDKSSEARELLKKISSNAVTEYEEHCLLKGEKYWDLFAYFLVLKKQLQVKNITRKQANVLHQYLDNSDTYPFSYYDFLSAVKDDYELEEFSELMSLDMDTCGEFWKSLCNALLVANAWDDLGPIVMVVVNKILGFAYLGDLSEAEEEVPEFIINDFQKCLKYQCDKLINWKTSAEDNTYVSEHLIKSLMISNRSIFAKMLKSSQSLEEEDKDDLVSTLDVLVLHSICDIIMMTDEPKSVKVEMIKYAVELAGLELEFSPEGCITEIANNTQYGQDFLESGRITPELGTMWLYLIKLQFESGVENGTFDIIDNLFNMFIQLRTYLSEKFNVDIGVCFTDYFMCLNRKIEKTLLELSTGVI